MVAEIEFLAHGWYGRTCACSSGAQAGANLQRSLSLWTEGASPLSAGAHPRAGRMPQRSHLASAGGLCTCKTICGLRGSWRGRQMWREGGCETEERDFEAFLGFVQFVEMSPGLACRTCAPRGQQSTDPWEARAQQGLCTSPPATEGLWISTVLRGRKRSHLNSRTKV